MSEATDLLELQSVDLEILRATKRLEELPEKRAILELRGKLREVQTLHRKAEVLVKKLDAEIKVRGDEIAMIAEKLAAEQAKVMATTDHRAVQSITREMDGLRRRTDKLEMEQLQFAERAEKARGQIGAIEDHLGKLSTKEAELIEQFKKVGSEIQGEVSVLEARRTALTKRMADELVDRYESVRAAKSGVGVGRLEDARCSACRMDLPSERLHELLHGPDVGVCPQCRRLIVVRGEVQ